MTPNVLTKEDPMRLRKEVLPHVKVREWRGKDGEIPSWHDFEPEERRDNMDQLERGQGDLKKTADGEQEIMRHKKTLLDSGLLEKIEKRRLELKNDVAHKFGLYPRLTYSGSMDSDHFLKEVSFLHTQYTVDLSGWYSSFCIEVKAGGIYWVKSGKQSLKINPWDITDHTVADWFWSLSKEGTHGGKPLSSLQTKTP